MSFKSWFANIIYGHRDETLRGQIASFYELVVKSCEDRHALQDARDLVPVAELVQDNLDILEGDYQDNLLPLLTKWFANEFFSWFKSPDCEKCNSELKSDGTRSNAEGLRVEIYKCNNPECDYTFDFIRHNDPAILLRTRQGRCGEWANCFNLILRAMDYDARIVLDTTDHVWNEVFSERKQEWIHVDPCEAVVDCPLLYELGWKKKLRYCIAFSQYEVLDVTIRYTKDMRDIRRTRYGFGEECENDTRRERELSIFLDQLTEKAVSHADDATRERVLKRRAIDKEHLKRFELGGRPDVDVSQLGGRKTGSLEWRLQRGECSSIIKKKHIIKVDQESVDRGCRLLMYHCDSDTYITSSTKNPQIRGWKNAIYYAENMDHKFERDWATSYLARYEGCPAHKEGKIQWRFDISELSDWSQMEISIPATKWPDSQLVAELVRSDGGESCAPLELKFNELNVLTPVELGDSSTSNVTSFDLVITLGGGQADDNVAWQKPQLFRHERRKRNSVSQFFIRMFRSEAACHSRKK